MAFQARTVTVAEGFDLTDEDRDNITNINQALNDYGRAVYASGEIDAIKEYRNAVLIYDQISLASMNEEYGGQAAARTNPLKNRIIFGRGEEGTRTWSRSFYGRDDGTASYGNAIWRRMDGRSFRAWAVAHEFGHLNGLYGPTTNRLETENRANAFARKMTPFINAATGSRINVEYGPD